MSLIGSIEVKLSILSKPQSKHFVAHTLQQAMDDKDTTPELESRSDSDFSVAFNKMDKTRVNQVAG